jgi:RNA polymerase sigma-70 factor (sigma-E family)
MRTSHEEEFRAYVVASRAALVHTATLLTAGDRHRAEDLVQTTLTRLYLAWPRIRPRDGLDAYARRALVNAMIDEQRRPFRRREHSHAEVPDHAETDSDRDFTRLHAALRALPPGMRAAVVFRHVHGFSVADTADALDCSEGNVKSQTARGLERLRTALDTPGQAFAPGRTPHRLHAATSRRTS